jgi:hypothetical protein
MFFVNGIAADVRRWMSFRRTALKSTKLYLINI